MPERVRHKNVAAGYRGGRKDALRLLREGIPRMKLSGPGEFGPPTGAHPRPAAALRASRELTRRGGFLGPAGGKGEIRAAAHVKWIRQRNVCFRWIVPRSSDPGHRTRTPRLPKEAFLLFRPGHGGR